jgi:putative PEP-CTERM system histidine kinase
MSDQLLHIVLLACALLWLAPVWRVLNGGAGQSIRLAVAALTLAQLFWLVSLARPDSLSAPQWLAFSHGSEVLRQLALWWLLRSLAKQTASGSAMRMVRNLFSVSLLIVLYSGVAPLVSLPTLRPLIPLTALTLSALLPMVLAEQIYRAADNEQRWTLKFVVLAVAVSAGMDLLSHGYALLYQRIHPELWLARGPASMVSAILLWAGLRRLLRIPSSVSMSHDMAFYTGTLTVATLFLLIAAGGAWYIRDWGGRWSTVLAALFLVAVIAALASLILSGRFRARLRVFLSRHFLPYRYDHRVEWLRLSDTLAKGAAEHALPQAVITALADIVDSPAGLLFLRREKQLECISSRNMPAPETPIRLNSSELALLDQHWIINRDDPDAAPPDWLTAIARGWLAIPLNEADRCIAMVILADPRAPHALNWEDYDLLKVAARHAGAVMAQQQANTALSRAEQFAALHQSTAFLAHDIKTIVAQLSLLTRNAERHRRNPEFIDDMLDTVSHSVGKMENILLQLRQQQPAMAGSTDRVDIHAMLTDVVARLSRFSPAPVLQPCQHPLVVTAPADALESVFSHMIRNAQEACNEHGEVRIETDSNEGVAIIRILDSGAGMTAEFIRDHLFAPFYSTKGVGGMGIGAFQSRTSIENMGGRLDVSSRVGTGSCFTIRLPLN